MSQAHVRNNTGCIEWYTPPALIEAARLVLGNIDLDPASCAEANAIVRAARFYSVNDDGLTKTWTGRVFMNPPYSNGTIGRFARKLIEHYRAAEISEAVVLVNNATETDWWQALARAAVAVCFIKGRLRFWRSEGAEEGTPLQGQTVLYFGSRPEAFKAVFGKLGKILGPLTVTISHEKKYQNMARWTLRDAVNRGLLTRAPVCGECGTRCFTYAHHPDYSKPLDVLWLCRKCHVALHIAERKTQSELFGQPWGRPVSFGRPMTPAERQRRSRMMRRNRDCQQHALAQGA